MCGIAGYVGSRPPDEAAQLRALERMAARGPDDRGVWTNASAREAIVLLHTRLAILDLDRRSAQPMTRGPLTAVYNGEIYNYRELRDELVRLGERFVTESDTEVLLAAYAAWGAECFARLEGMWALALHDERDRSLHLCRDRFGEKPLRLMRAGDGWFFGSEARFLFALSGTTPRVNERHVARFLVHGYKSLWKTEEQFLEGVIELPPGTYARLEAGRPLRPQRYVPLPCCVAVEQSFEHAVAAVRERLIEAVRLRLRADVPVACCLSGGVDSGAIASIAIRELRRPVVTLSIVDTDPRYDESQGIRRTVTDLGCENHAVSLATDGGLDRLDELVAHRWAPVLTLSYFVHARLSEEAARRGLKVVLSGTGADELFTGYYDHFNLHLHELRGRPEYERARSDWLQHIRPLVRNPDLQDPDLYARDAAAREHVYLNRRAFAAMLRRGFDEPFHEWRYSDSLLRNRMMNELLHEVVPPILHEDDANSMRVSVENRSPFLDSRLVETACAIPPGLLIRDGMAKRVLRSAVRGLLHDGARLDRRKVGFNCAIESVLDIRSPRTQQRLLADGPIFEIVRREAIAEALAMNPIPNSYSKFLFSFASTRLFMDHIAAGGASRG